MPVPPGVVTVTGTDNAAPGGAMAMIFVSEKTVKTASVASKATLWARVRLEPVRVTVFRPEAGPWDGATLVTTTGTEV